MNILILLLITTCDAMVHRHPPKYVIIHGETYINYYTMSGYT